MTKPSQDIPLPLPTNATVEGPRLHIDEQRLILEYDHESEDGQVRWIRLVFEEVQVVQYYSGSSCGAEHIQSSRILRRFNSSPMLTEILARRKTFLGIQWPGDDETFGHFRLYFDDVACIDIIANNWRTADGTNE